MEQETKKILSNAVFYSCVLLLIFYQKYLKTHLIDTKLVIKSK